MSSHSFADSSIVFHFLHARYINVRCPKVVLNFGGRMAGVNRHHYEQLGNLLPLRREIAGARDILQKFENLKKQDE